MIDERVTNAVYRAVDHFSEQSDKGHQLKKSPTTTLFGKGGQLDSLDLVSFIVEVEQEIEQEFNIPIVLADERALSQRHSPFMTLGALAEYVSQLIEEHERNRRQG